MTPYPNQLPYVAAKYGLTGLIQGLALELAAHNIRVNGIAPSTVKTDLALNPIFFELFTGNPDAGEDDVAPMFQAMNLIQRPWIDPEEISDAVVWLSSDASRCITGVVLPTDLGFLIKGPFDAVDSAMKP
jgi:NAD(P)-dependent dehydrogenase (short-subunit alcohol dehydrogenase family)